MVRRGAPGLEVLKGNFSAIPAASPPIILTRALKSPADYLRWLCRAEDKPAGGDGSLGPSTKEFCALNNPGAQAKGAYTPSNAEESEGAERIIQGDL